MKILSAHAVLILLLISCASPAFSQMTQADFLQDSKQADQFIREQHWDIAKKMLLGLTKTSFAREHEFCQLAFCYIGAFPTKEDYAIADRYAHQSTMLNPEYGHAYLARAICAIELYKDDACLIYSTKCLTCKLPDLYGHYIRARAYIQLQKYSEALADLQAWGDAVGKIDKRQIPYSTEAEVYEKMGKLDEAVKYFRLDQSIHPEQAIKNTVRCLRKQKHYVEAISEVSLLIKRNAEDSDAYNVRASIKADNKDLRGAIADYGKAIEMSPTPTYYKNRAHIYEQLGETTLAKKDFANADKSQF